MAVEAMENLFLAPAISGFFNVMFDRMITRDFQNFLASRRRTKVLVGELRREMIKIEKLLSDAEEKQTANSYVKSWLDEVKDAYYAAEDLVDKIDTEALHQKTQARTGGSQIAAAFDSFFRGVDLVISDILQRLHHLEDEIVSLGLKEGPTREPSTSFVEESEIFGRDSERDEIINFLVDIDTTDFSPEERSELIERRLNRSGWSKEFVREYNRRWWSKGFVLGYNRRETRLVTFPFEWADWEASTSDSSKKMLLTTNESRAKLKEAKSVFRPSPDKRLCIVAITGFSGVGKTTLAQLVYNDKRLPDICGLKSWVCVSEALGDVRQITKTILNSIPSCSSELESNGLFHGSEDLNSLQGTLLRRLLKSGKKFLIVLDDVLENESRLLDDMINPLKSVAAGGIILITTSNNLVAERMFPDYTLHLDKLPDKDCWRLVEKHAFQSHPDCEADKRMTDIAMKLAQKCNGLPLAARMVGRLLGSTRAERWEEVLDSDTWLQQDVLPALLLSYNYLPSCLKRCFAYCSMFPESYIFERETIVQLWMAEGFISAQKCSLPQVSDSYFDELVSRSFFQQSSSNKSQFVMHSLIHELARYVSGEFSCFLVDDNCPESTRQTDRFLSHRTRHLSYSQNEYDTVGRFSRVLSEVNYLRTFFPRRSFDSSSCFLSKDVLVRLTNNFRRTLRVLSLSRYKITGRHLSHIDKLEHLRYLDLSYTSIRSLPESVCTFYHLQTLLLSDCHNLTWLPGSIGNLKQLLFLNLSRTKISELPPSLFTLCNLHALLLSQCPIGVLPAELGNLTSLCHLDISGTELQHVPVQIGKLSRLRTLTNFIVGKNGGANIEVLGKIRHLKGSLHISNLDHAVAPTADGSEQILQGLRLNELVLEWYCQTDQPTGAQYHVLHSLLQYDQAESVVIKYGSLDFRSWLLLGKNMVSLRLEECVIACSWGENIRFPCLKHLCLRNLKLENPTNSERFDLYYPADCLETLRIEGLCIRILWLIRHTVGGGPAKLREVYLRDCAELETINWEDTDFMRKLEIIKCNKLLGQFPHFPLDTLILQECDALLPNQTERLYNDRLRSLHIGGEILDMNLVMSRCPDIEELIINDYPHGLNSLPTSLRFLSISYCRSLELDGYGPYPHLQRLSIISPQRGPFTGFHLGRFTNLAYLEIKAWFGLDILTSSFPPYLSVVSISDCPELVIFDGGSAEGPGLATLSISRCQKLQFLPGQMPISLRSLQSLSINDCPEIDSLPDGGFPPCLHTLCVKSCPKLMSCRTHWPLKQMSCLRKLEIEGCYTTISFPEKNFLPASLTHLKITAFTNLSYLDVSELCRLTSLRALEISLCWNLRSFPERMPPSLCYLEIVGCPHLAERCERDKGRDWYKISHLLGINIDDEDI